MTKQFSRGRALVVGVASYPSVRPLPRVVLDDARDIAQVLRSPEYCGYPPSQVEVLLDGDATNQRIRDGLARLARESGTDDTAVFYFSGHGGREETGPHAGTYLIPYDCELPRLRETAIECAELTEIFKAIAAGRLVILLDACHSAGAGELKDLLLSGSMKAGLGQGDYDRLVAGSGRIIMSSSRADESSWTLPGMSNSLFTHHLLEALKGAAVCPGEDVVRVFEVFRYVSDRVPSQRCDQHPVFKAHDVEGSFPIALHRGGVKSPDLHSASATASGPTRPAALSGPCKLEICHRLVDRWADLATFLDIHPHDRARFERGHEPRGILEWLEQRGRLAELRDAFNALGWDDLIGVLAKYPR